MFGRGGSIKISLHLNFFNSRPTVTEDNIENTDKLLPKLCTTAPKTLVPYDTVQCSPSKQFPMSTLFFPTFNVGKSIQ